MLNPKERVATNKMFTDDFELPFIQDNEFDYYPEPSPRSHKLYGDDRMATTERSLVLGKASKRTKLVKKKVWDDLWLESVLVKMLTKLRLKK